MSTLKVNALMNTSGHIYPQVKGRVKFNGRNTISIAEDDNVSSVADDGAGYYSINHSITYQTSNYVQCCAGTATNSAGGSDVCPRINSISTGVELSTTTQARVTAAHWNGSAHTDPWHVYLAFI